MALTKSWLLALALIVPGIAHADAHPPDRKVHGTTITSTHDPLVKIRLPKAARYAGAARWDLYQVADAELHVFVEANASRRVQRLYWVQFESYLPNNSFAYEYPFTERTTLGGRDFDVSFRFDRTDKPLRPGSDFERVRMLVGEAGFHLASETMQVRLVHLLEATKRQELMFIYSEDLAASGVTAADLNHPATWEKLKPDLLERAKSRIHLAF